ncbi:hypothetical protein F511_13399 [Dorcoceras hygrometricum]|uniref:Uncharacterized protein n=1 Tax=Dorcoceras hygrometricum TaxID=472368 RepID=A0A2Z7B8U3_9LAMI|nr:hypothetical protein F511_13399 [Dorcoceras hygrometricum]
MTRSLKLAQNGVAPLKLKQHRVALKHAGQISPKRRRSTSRYKTLTRVDICFHNSPNTKQISLFSRADLMPARQTRLHTCEQIPHHTSRPHANETRYEGKTRQQPDLSTQTLLTRVDFYPRLANRSQHLTNTSRNNSRTPVATTHEHQSQQLTNTSRNNSRTPVATTHEHRSQHLTNTSRNNSQTPVATTPLKIPVAATVHNQSQLQCTTSRSYSAQHTKHAKIQNLQNCSTHEMEPENATQTSKQISKPQNLLID